MDKRTAHVIVRMLGDKESQDVWMNFLQAKLDKIHYAMEICPDGDVKNYQGKAWQVRDFMKLRATAEAVLNEGKENGDR